MSKKKILIVDDEPHLVDMLKMRLEVNGYEAIGAYDGREGLEKAKQYKPNLIILDIMMPEMSGNDMARALKNNDETRDIPIIFLTCLAEGITEAQKGSVVADNLFLAKPFEPQVLLAKIQELLEK